MLGSYGSSKRIRVDEIEGKWIGWLEGIIREERGSLILLI